MILRHDPAAPFSDRCGVRVVKSDQPPAAFVVESEAIAQAVWSFGTPRHPLYDESGDVLASSIDDHYFAIKIKQERKSRILIVSHLNTFIIRS